MSKKLITSSVLFLLSVLIAVTSLSSDRIHKAKIGEGYQNGSQIEIVPIRTN